MSAAWITLATTDGYAIGALVLAHSLRNVKTKHTLHVLYTNSVSSQLIEQLKSTFDYATEVNVLDSNDSENLALINRPDLGVTFTKLHCWRLTQYSKCVFLDADTFVLQNCDELMDHPELSAAPDIGWPDYFNSGVFVFVPSETTYQNLLNFALSYGSFDGGDQGLLNKFFYKWREQDVTHRLSFLYNVTSNAVYSYAAAIKRHLNEIKIIHFLGKQKPWHFNLNETNSQYLQQWHNVYLESVHHRLPSSLSVVSCVNQKYEESLMGIQLQDMKFTSSNNNTSVLNEGDQRYEAWEHGLPDYTGKDSYENIQKKIENSLK